MPPFVMRSVPSIGTVIAPSARLSTASTSSSTIREPSASVCCVNEKSPVSVCPRIVSDAPSAER